MKRILERGSDWPVTELSKEVRVKDLQSVLRFGNHKGATANPALLRELIKKDVKHGYALVLPLAKVHRIPGLSLAPMNIQKQNTINETGRIVDKDRLTHDQSYDWSVGSSVNSRVDKTQLLPCMFGACIKRLANWAVAARKEFPNRRILATKVDYKSAYRRCHVTS